MQGYDDSTPLQRKEGANSTSETGPKRFWRTAWFQVALALVLIVLLAMSITCCVLLGVFHSNLMFLCSYAEFMSLIVLQGIIAIFVCYHSYHIYKFFVPSKEEDDHENYGRIDEEDDQEEYEDDNDFENSKPMKVLFFIFKLLALLISLLAFAALVTLTITTITIQQLSFPQVNGTIKLLGLNNKATVQREANGMIHIKASNNHDLFFAQGVVTAQERMWQLEFHRRLASGTLSEILGAEALTTDKWSRTVGFYRAANATMSELPSDVVALVQAFCDGINAYIATGQHLAPEFGQIILDTKPQPWEPIDVVAFSKAVAWGLGLNAEVEVLRYKLLQQGISMDRVNQLYPLYPDDGPTVLSAKDLNINVTQKEIDELNKKFTNDSGAYIPLKQQFADFSTPYQSVSSLLNHFIGTHRASNNWVIGKQFTKTGKPLLANDPHLAFSAPGIWILMHLESDELNVVGATFAGAPGILIGQNPYIAWGVTNTAVDVQDLYVMQDINNGTQYMYKGQPNDYKLIRESIKVKGQEDVLLEVKESVYGPVVNDIFNVSGPSMSMWYSATQLKDTTMIAFFKVVRSKNWQEFTDALSYYVVPSQNFVFADRDGNIGYYAAGKVPIRREGHSGRYPVNGDGSFDYDGFIPFEQMPHVYNPEEGFIVSANNKITPPGYNYSLTLDWENQYRSSRIVELINELKVNASMTVEDMKAIQLDVKSKIFEEYSFIFSAIKGNLSAEAEPWADRLASWDGEMKEGSEEAAVFEAWWGRMMEITVAETGSPIYKRYPNFMKRVLKSGDDMCMHFHNMTCTMYAAHAFNESITKLEELFGGTAPSWGTDVHETQFKHLVLGDSALKCLASKNVYTVGGSETVNVADTIYPELTTVEGVSYRQIIDLNQNANDTNASDYFIIPLGQSGNWLSKFYDNFIWQWRAGEYINMKFVGYNVANTLELSSN